MTEWRQWKHCTRVLQKHFQKVRQTRRTSSDDVEAYLDASRELVRRAQETIPLLVERGVGTLAV